MLPRFTVTMCVSLAIVVGKYYFRPGDLAIFGIVFCLLVCFLGATIAIFSAIAIVLGVLERFLLIGVAFLFSFE